MIYVMGGPNGYFEKYSEMLQKLNLSDADDSLFILGNVIGGGPDSIRILKDMMYRPNIFPLLGTNEFFAKAILPLLSGANSVEGCAECIDENSKGMFASWIQHGALKTIEQFIALDEEGKDSIIDYLSEFTPYEEVEAKGRDFVLTHAGIKNFSADTPLESFDEADFVFEKADYTKVYYTDRFLVTAAEPTKNIPGGKDGRVFSGKHHLCLLCEQDAQEKIAAVCLDTLKVYYC